MFNMRKFRLKKWKANLLCSIEKSSLEDKEVVCFIKDDYSNDFLVTFYKYESLIFIQVYHYPHGISKLIAILYEDKISISDIKCYKNNKGYGSILMSELIKYARSINIKFIDGWLAEIDVSDHRDRLIKFYEKFGFEIKLSDSNDMNRIYDIDLRL